jgi:hypothetical protein
VPQTQARTQRAAGTLRDRVLRLRTYSARRSVSRPLEPAHDNSCDTSGFVCPVSTAQATVVHAPCFRLAGWRAASTTPSPRDAAGRQAAASAACASARPVSRLYQCCGPELRPVSRRAPAHHFACATKSRREGGGESQAPAVACLYSPYSSSRCASVKAPPRWLAQYAASCAAACWSRPRHTKHAARRRARGRAPGRPPPTRAPPARKRRSYGPQARRAWRRRRTRSVAGREPRGGLSAHTTPSRQRSTQQPRRAPWRESARRCRRTSPCWQLPRISLLHVGGLCKFSSCVARWRAEGSSVPVRASLVAA